MREFFEQSVIRKLEKPKSFDLDFKIRLDSVIKKQDILVKILSKKHKKTKSFNPTYTGILRYYVCYIQQIEFFVFFKHASCQNCPNMLCAKLKRQEQTM